MRFVEKVVIVTGGASGIGRSTALAFADEGASVVIADLNQRASEDVVRLIRDRGRAATAVPTDVSQPHDWTRLVGETVRLYGRIDVLFNNAGIEGATAATADYPEEAFDRVLAINLKGVWLGMRAVIPRMLAQGKGAIVNMSSILGLVGFASAAAYTASKHGVLGLTKVAALEYAAHGIRINAVCPGFIRTPMVMERGLAHLPNAREVLAQVSQLHPVGRFGEPDEVARAVLFLASDEASFLTGAAVPIDGGYTIR